jgi:putative tryptophan/tyrosine transport system substrate-binding protein
LAQSGWNFLRRSHPGVARAGIVYNPDSGTISALLWQAIKEAAQRMGIELVDMPIRNEAEIEREFVTFAGDPNGGLIFPSDVFTVAHRARIIEVANDRRIPTVFPLVLRRRWRARII